MPTAPCTIGVGIVHLAALCLRCAVPCTPLSPSVARPEPAGVSRLRPQRARALPALPHRRRRPQRCGREMGCRTFRAVRVLSCALDGLWTSPFACPIHREWAFGCCPTRVSQFCGKCDAWARPGRQQLIPRKWINGMSYPRSARLHPATKFNGRNQTLRKPAAYAGPSR